MSVQPKQYKQDLPTSKGQVLADVLDHSNDLVDRLVGMDNKKGWQEGESNAGPKLFRAISEEVGKTRLFVCCDGTWLNASGTTAPLTNVARFARAINRFGLNQEHPASPVTQLTYYSAGVGSESVLQTRVDSLCSGITGAGLEEDILNAYCFICNNYNFSAKNDEIILIGFSRGAFTVRCLADFISQVGLLRRKTLPFLPVLFQRWMGTKEDVDRERMKREIKEMSPKFSLSVKITVLGEWDTVSAIGHVGCKKKFSFMKETVPESVQNAFLAVALNERRGSFKPMVYTKARGGTNVSQCAFVGCHADIGGGNLDAGLSTVSLLWMAAKVQGACQASFSREALLQMVQPPRPNKRWWYGRNIDETVAMNLLWSKGNINESLWGPWYIPHALTFGWSSGSRRRLLRKTFKRAEQDEKHSQNTQQRRTMQRKQRKTGPAAKFYEARYECDKLDNVIETVNEDVARRIKDGITKATRAADTERLTATVKTAIHARDVESTETRIIAIINATLTMCPDEGKATAHRYNETPVRSAVPEMEKRGSDSRLDNAECNLKIHFTAKELVKELRYRSKEGFLEGLWDKLGWLGHERNQLVDYLPQESYDDNEKKLWDEWKSQMNMWHASNEGRKEGWDQDVVYWSDILTRFDKGDTPESETLKGMVKWEVCTNQLCRVADAAAATAQAGLHSTVANVAEAGIELESAAHTVTRLVEMAEPLKDSEDGIMKAVWFIMGEVKEVFEHLPAEILSKTAEMIVGVTETITEEVGAAGMDQTTTEKGTTHALALEYEKVPQTDIAMSIQAITGRLADLAEALMRAFHPLPAPDAGSETDEDEDTGDEEEDSGGDDHDWSAKLSKARRAIGLMVEKAKALQVANAPSSELWEAVKRYAVRARNAAERAAQSIANATILWKLTDEQKREALCYRMAYPEWKSTGVEHSLEE